MLRMRLIPIGILIFLLVVIQVIITLAGANYLLNDLILALYYALIAVGVCLLMGFAGQISLGHAGFFGIGAYVQAVLTTVNLVADKDTPFVSVLDSLGLLVAGKDLYGNDILYVSPWVSFFLVVLISLVIAFLIGIPVLRLKGHYLAMATLGFGLIIHTLVSGIGLFGAADGKSDVPAFSLLPGVEISGSLDIRVGNYYIAAFFLIIGIIIALNLIHSRVGRALRAIHGNEQAAASLGINAGRYKLYVFVISAVFAAIGGALLVHYNGSIGPSDIDLTKSVRFVAIVAAGGMDSLWGVVSMGVFLNFISLRKIFGTFDDIFFACILIVIMLFLPQGLVRLSYFEGLRLKLKKRFAG